MKSLSRRERLQQLAQDDSQLPILLRQLRGNAAMQAQLTAQTDSAPQEDDSGGLGFIGGFFSDVTEGLQDFFECVDDKIIDPITDFLFGDDQDEVSTDTEASTKTSTEAGGSGAVVEEPVEEQPVEAEHVATDAESLVRTPPPELASTGEVIPVGTMLHVISEVSSGGRAYAEVEGEDGRAWGWTLKSNLSHRKAYDPSMAIDQELSIEGLGGTSLAMAQIYNSKGAYLSDEADRLGVQVEDTAAVLKAESGGAGFGEDGDMIIRFENHIFYRYWGQSNPETYREHFQHGSGQAWKNHMFREDAGGQWESFHGDQSAEWRVLTFARGLDDTAALMSISMGAAQIMGFNHEGQGFATVQEMFEQMGSGIRPQLDGLFTFIANNPTCLSGLRSGDYVQFAGAYNGSGQAEYYGGLIENYAATLRGLLDAQGVG